MHSSFETIYIPKNTFGTQLEFTVFDEDRVNESVSGYDSIKLRAYNPRGELAFSGDVDETLSEASSNIVHYTFQDGDLKNAGLYKVFLEFIRLSGTAIAYKNTVEVAKIKVE